MKKLAVVALVAGLTGMLAACGASKQSMCAEMADKIVKRAIKAVGGSGSLNKDKLEAARKLSIASCMKHPEDKVKAAYDRMKNLK